jgi:predicted MFS family arabinose efflux permease
VTDKVQDIDTPEYGPVYRGVLLTLIMLVSAFAYVDRTVVQILGQPIKDDLGLSDFQLGLIGGLCFAIFYSTLGLPIARLAERKDRITIISVSVAVFSAASALCGAATSFTQLFLFRVGVGFGEAGVSPPSTSLIGDYFPPHRRGFALTIMRLGAPVGAAFGSFFGAWVGLHYGWRVAMVAISVPGLVVALLFRLILREPPRGMCDPPEQRAAAATMPPLGEAFRILFRAPGMIHLVIGLGVTTMGLYSAGAFNVPFFMRVHGLSLQRAGAYLGLISTFASLIGMSCGGLLIDFAAKRGAKWYALLPLIGVGISAPAYFYAYMFAGPTTTMVLMLVGGIFMFFHSVPTLVAMQNRVPPNIRATAAFVYFFISTLVGVGLGPPVTGFLSDVYATMVLGSDFASHCPGKQLVGACAQASGTGLRYALGTSCVFLVWGCVHFAFAARILAREEEAA